MEQGLVKVRGQKISQKRFNSKSKHLEKRGKMKTYNKTRINRNKNMGRMEWIQKQISKVKMLTLSRKTVKRLNKRTNKRKVILKMRFLQLMRILIQRSDRVMMIIQTKRRMKKLRMKRRVKISSSKTLNLGLIIKSRGRRNSLLRILSRKKRRR